MPDDSDDFYIFCGALGRLMVEGLNQLPADTRRMVARHQKRGARIVAVCSADPPCLIGALDHPDLGTATELFKITAEGLEESPEWLH